jgi:hypothetical protein
MNAEVLWLAKPATREPKGPKPFNLAEILLLDQDKGYRRPLFQYVIRQFASSRVHSKEDITQFIEAFEESSFEEEMYNSRDVTTFPLGGTMRYARRTFWKLVSLERPKAAARVIDLTMRVIEIAENRSWRIYGRDQEDTERKREQFKHYAQVCHDRVALFMMERYVKQDAGYDFFSGQVFKKFLAYVFDASSEVEHGILLTLLKGMKEKCNSYHGIHVEGQDWVKVRLVLLALMGENKRSLPRKVLIAMGELINTLTSATYHHGEFSHHKWKRYLTANEVRMKEYLFGVQTVLSHAYLWLCGKQLFKEQGLVIKPWFYG